MSTTCYIVLLFLGSQDEVFGFSRREIYLLMKDNLKSDLKIIVQNLEEKLSSKCGLSIEIDTTMAQKISALFYVFRNKYQMAQRKEDKFLQTNNDWLNSLIFFRVRRSTPTKPIAKKTGRPSMEFLCLSDRSKRRRTEEMRSDFDVDTLSYATQMSLRFSGNVSASKVLKDISSSSPSKAEKYLRAVK